MNKRTAFVKNGNKWEKATESTNTEGIYKSLLADLTAQKRGHSSVTSIKCKYLYNGEYEYIVYYSNAVKAVYNVTL